jgi:hypothetical protein
VIGFDGLFALAFIFEQVGQIFKGLGFPFVELVGMYPVLGCNLCNRPLFFEYFQHNLGFLFGGVTLFHGSSLHLKTAHLCVQNQFTTSNLRFELLLYCGTLYRQGIRGDSKQSSLNQLFEPLVCKGTVSSFVTVLNTKNLVCI